MAKISKFIALLCRTEVRNTPAESCYDTSLLNSSFDHLQSILHETSHLATTLSVALDIKEDCEQTLSTVLHIMSDGIIIIDCNSVIQTWNDGASAIFGYSSSDAVGKHIDHITCGQYLIECMPDRQLNDTLYPVNITHKNGTILSLELIVNSICNREGEPHLYVAVIRDVSNRCEICNKI
jgi:PAS domain S-box-containing protein